MLASCSFDRKVKIWRETSPREWQCVYTYDGHELSVNSVAWGPHEFGPVLACGSSDGFISILTLRENGQWDPVRFHAHQIGVNAVSWAPPAHHPPAGAGAGGSGAAAGPAGGAVLRRLVSAGSDNLVKVWRWVEEAVWRTDERDTLEGHGDWVRDVAWAPSIGLSSSQIASASQDGTVFIWSQDEPGGPWARKALPRFSEVVWRLSWSITGNVLAVAQGDQRVSLWKEALDGEWVQIASLDDSTAAAQAS
jgi:protein transport protein SEC13